VRGEVCVAEGGTSGTAAQASAQASTQAAASPAENAPPAVEEPAQAVEGDYAWSREAAVLLDVSTGRLGARARLEYPLKKNEPSGLAIGGGLGLLTSAIGHDSTWVFPLEAIASYRIGLFGGRAQVMPTAGFNAALLFNGSAGFALKASVGGRFRWALGGLGAHRGVTAGLELLIPLVGGGWVVMLPVGFTF
jgi:hypothetical protein